MMVEEYALKVLAEHGCDCFTYGGASAEFLLGDLKKEYPKGMEYPYVDVANAILSISRPKPIRRAPYRLCWETDDCADGADCDDFEAAKCRAEDTLCEWMAMESSDWECLGNEWETGCEYAPTDEQKVSWDYMIYNSGVSISKYCPETDEYYTVWEPSEKELKELGWKPFSE